MQSISMQAKERHLPSVKLYMKKLLVRIGQAGTRISGSSVCLGFGNYCEGLFQATSVLSARTTGTNRVDGRFRGEDFGLLHRLRANQKVLARYCHVFFACLLTSTFFPGISILKMVRWHHGGQREEQPDIVALSQDYQRRSLD
jgi:hypothetical protein